MYLEKEQRDKLYELFFYLLDYTNNKYKINKKMLGKLDGKHTIDAGEIVDIRERLWKDNIVIDEYLKENPDNLKEKDLEIIESWKNRVNDVFIMAKHLKKYTILLNDKDTYGIVGISNEISDIISSDELPVYVKMVLIPFGDVITYDTLLIPYMISLGPGIKKRVNEDYIDAKNNNEIIYSLNDMKKVSEEEKVKKYKYYEIKVTLKGTHPPVWRRLQIPSNITFDKLSKIIQIAFGWSGYHLYEFEIAGNRYTQGTLIGVPSEYEWEDYNCIDAKKIKIDKFLENIRKFEYKYDFGDDWKHEIVVEKVIKTNEKLIKPVCVKAKMQNLEEDSGGVWANEQNTNESFFDIDALNKKFKNMKL